MNGQLVILLQTVLVGVSMVSLRVLARTKEACKASFAISASMYLVLYASMLLLLPWLGSVHTEMVRQYWWRSVGGGVAFAASASSFLKLEAMK